MLTYCQVDLNGTDRRHKLITAPPEGFGEFPEKDFSARIAPEQAMLEMPHLVPASVSAKPICSCGFMPMVDREAVFPDSM
jgi:hypothetical protein